jgi:hypothetical protein
MRIQIAVPSSNTINKILHYYIFTGVIGIINKLT